MILKDKFKDSVSELLFKFKDEYRRIDCDIPFCIDTINQIHTLFKGQIKNAKDWKDLHGISVQRLKNE